MYDTVVVSEGIKGRGLDTLRTMINLQSHQQTVAPKVRVFGAKREAVLYGLKCGKRFI